MLFLVLSGYFQNNLTHNFTKNDVNLAKMQIVYFVFPFRSSQEFYDPLSVYKDMYCVLQPHVSLNAGRKQTNKRVHSYLKKVSMSKWCSVVILCINDCNEVFGMSYTRIFSILLFLPQGDNLNYIIMLQHCCFCLLVFSLIVFQVFLIGTH